MIEIPDCDFCNDTGVHLCPDVDEAVMIKCSKIGCKTRAALEGLYGPPHRRSRLDEEYIMAVVRNRSGVDAGEIDYSLHVGRLDIMDMEDLKVARQVIGILADRINDRVDALLAAEVSRG